MSLEERYMENGPHVPVKTIGEVEPNESIGKDIVPELIAEYTLEDIEEVYNDKKAMNFV